MRIPCLWRLILGLGFATTVAGAFTLVPMSVTFAPKGKGVAQTFRVANESSNRVAFEIRVLTWDLDADGKETNSPAAGLFTVFPPQGAIAPGKSQMVRVVWRGPSNPEGERAFRLVAEELPVNFTPETNKVQIKLQLRYVAAVYVRPPKARPTLEATAFTRSGPHTWLLTVVNSGQAHQNLVDPTLTLTDAAGRSREVPAEVLRPLAGANVLAGHTRRFVLTLPADFSEPSYRARLTAHE